MGTNAKQPMVSVVVIVHNGKETIEDCLNSLLTQTVPKNEYEIIVVDNSSTDNSPEIIQRYPTRFYTLEGVGNYGGARNKGVKEANGQIVAFVDADCTVPTDYISTIIDFHQNNPDVSGLAGCLINPYPNNKVARTLNYGQCGYWSINAPKRYVEFLPGCNSSYKRADLLDVGIFPECTASEDILLGWKMTAKGKKLMFDPSHSLVHRFDRSLNILSVKEERCGHAHFKMHASKKKQRIVKLWGRIFFAPFYMLGRSLTGFQRVLLYSSDKQDSVILFPYVVYSGFFWTRGYLKEALNQKITKRVK
jgi:glycosyltransferase involved in cell wall biosynthesis